MQKELEKRFRKFQKRFGQWRYGVIIGFAIGFVTFLLIFNLMVALTFLLTIWNTVLLTIIFFMWFPTRTTTPSKTNPPAPSIESKGCEECGSTRRHKKECSKAKKK